MLGVIYCIFIYVHFNSPCYFFHVLSLSFFLSILPLRNSVLLVRSDRRYIAVIPHHDSDDNNLPGPATPRLSVLSLAISLETLYFSPSISVSLSRNRFSCNRFYLDALRLFSPLRIVPLGSIMLQRDLSLSPIRKFADPISTKLHCVPYLHAVVPIYSVRNCTLPSPFSFTSRYNRYFTLTYARIQPGGTSPSTPIRLANTGKKICHFDRRVSCLPVE